MKVLFREMSDFYYAIKCIGNGSSSHVILWKYNCRCIWLLTVSVRVSSSPRSVWISHKSTQWY